MYKENSLTISIKYVAVDLLGSILYWPIWWYTQGFFKLLEITWKNIIDEEKRFGIRIWLANLFVPMFGQYDWQGRLISMFMRFVMLIGKIIMFLIWIILMLVIIILWLILPLLAIYMIIINFYNFFE